MRRRAEKIDGKERKKGAQSRELRRTTLMKARPRCINARHATFTFHGFQLRVVKRTGGHVPDWVLQDRGEIARNLGTRKCPWICSSIDLLYKCGSLQCDSAKRGGRSYIVKVSRLISRMKFIVNVDLKNAKIFQNFISLSLKINWKFEIVIFIRRNHLNEQKSN